MASFAEYEAGYENNWTNLQIRPNRVADAQKQAKLLQQGESIYQEIESKSGVPWWFVGLCHYRESNYNFNTYLGNGQSLSQRTTIVPVGRGPFTGPTAFVDGALDALRLQGFVGATDWGIARVLYRLEGFNGYGYHGYGVNSPYLYGGSTCYGPPEARGGKYVADHDFNPDVIDTQLGTAVILKSLMELDSSISFVTAPPTAPDQPAQPDDELAESVLWVQQSLNKLGAKPQLVEDGISGPQTMAAVSQFQQQHNLQSTGLANAATIAAIQLQLTPTPAQQQTQPPPQPQPSATAIDLILQRLAQLEKTIGALSGNTGVVPIAGPAQVSTPPNDLTALLQLLMTIMQQGQAQGTATPAPTAAQLADQLQKIAGLLAQILAPGDASKSLPLGQVNGALGQTLGNLLDGKKTAIGISGAVLTSLLSQVPPGTGLGQVLATLTPAAGLSPFTMPLFLGLTAWGALGKLEKWSQGTVPPSQPQK